jgi:hypothetical protein
VLDEILEERVVSSRGRRVPRGVKRKMSSYPLRPRASQPIVRIDFTTAIMLLLTRASNMYHRFFPIPGL